MIGIKFMANRTPAEPQVIKLMMGTAMKFTAK
jgi:hypothetical protein